MSNNGLKKSESETMHDQGIVRMTNHDEHLHIMRSGCAEKGFYYRYKNGRRVTKAKVLTRIERLVIPPNWRSVRISKLPKASIQAIGKDEKNRRQYIYHYQWHKQQQAEKFASLRQFGLAIDDFRTHCFKYLETKAWSLERVCALVGLLLDKTGARIGHSQYTQENSTYGLSTLRRKHAEVREDRILFKYTGKHNKPRTLEVTDPTLSTLVEECINLQGYAIFRYQTNDAKWRDLTSEDMNHFIHQYMSDNYSCKYFRTWAASRIALRVLPEVHASVNARKNRKWAPTLAKHVSKVLGNTPVVCRKYYIHPKLFAALDDQQMRNELISNVNTILNEKCEETSTQVQLERLLLKVIS
ncbi:DNA topoisomerase IB [Alteromonas sp. A079]|uniref:DNA topoisomerase IB n=1 Tax=Alteromonas sp. A079 TaxID=3410268 RepID=UPI003BA2CCAB